MFSGESVLVTNLVLDLEKVFGLPTLDSQWAAQVTRYTVSKINRHLPPVPAVQGGIAVEEADDRLQRTLRNRRPDGQALS